jgi:hypothetical protein
MKRPGLICLAILIATTAVLPARSSTIPFTVPDMVVLPGCFDADPNIGGLDRNAHLVWARRQTQETIANNLSYKIALLFNCQSVNGERLANAFADISVIVGNYAPDSSCFGSDRSANGRDRSAHDQWARTKTRDEVRNNLQWKAAVAAKCTDARYAADFFADVSVVVARTAASPGGTTTTTSGGCGNDYGLQAPSSASTGSQMRVRFSYKGARPTSQSDWIGLMKAGTNDYVGWYWVKDLQGCEVIFTAPAPGYYEFRYFLEGGYEKVTARSSLTVQ